MKSTAQQAARYEFGRPACYYVQTTAREVLPVKGYPVKLATMPDVPCFAHRAVDAPKLWRVSETQTGAVMGVGCYAGTKREAARLADEDLRHRGLTTEDYLKALAARLYRGLTPVPAAAPLSKLPTR